ncbi:gamma carbonic anhydrase family protein [Notoacmeibacter marinus]|uniref:gamma carbonic anhydrase family protein n=1 Tax=Notoacmeibacter marinus TaxID=1876515 RepID=UPI000DF41667|nr:gamma carbonic anhydrase family protein [Notoacmeibacter marinus]
MTLYRLGDRSPELADETVFVAPGAQVMGNVILGAQVGIWFNAVLRGDNEPITIGARTNIQDLTMIHTDPGAPVTIGEGCTIGHKAIIHGCTIGDNSLIGMGATVLNRAKIGKNCLIGAGALITEGKDIPDGSLVVGAPGKVVRQLDEGAISALRMSAENYVQNAARFLADLQPFD